MAAAMFHAASFAQWAGWPFALLCGFGGVWQCYDICCKAVLCALLQALPVVTRSIMESAPAGFAQWKAFLHLLLGCEAAPLHSHIELYRRFLIVLSHQLKHSLDEVRDVKGRACMHSHA